MTTLGRLQQRFQSAILAGDRTPGLFIDEENDRRNGVAIYQQAYRARLAGALRDNYPVVHRSMGDEAFAALADAYIAASPSHFRSIRWFGDTLADFLAGSPAHLPHPALADLARMDWALRGAFDAADAPVLTSAEVGRLRAEQWPTQRFTPLPSLRLVELAWRIEPIWKALDEDPDAQTTAPVFDPHWLLVWRPGLDCLWRSADADEAKALQTLQQGASFAECCAQIADSAASDPAATAIDYLRRWLADGLLAKAQR
ncbi:MAG: putative DNA-binding domain-containing protein [Candidatus Accumulibacter sp.]|nr:putative DNA-binding domain-containing protein [Accumulibacter sp.]